jgi:uncharacterized protein YgiM (DUF1202 family)
VAGKNTYAEMLEKTKATINAESLRVRESYSTTAKVIGKVKKGDMVEVLEKSDEAVTIDNISSHWYNISFGKDRQAKAGYSAVI